MTPLADFLILWVLFSIILGAALILFGWTGYYVAFIIVLIGIVFGGANGY